ncbi:MAG: cytochrome b N-terminal domain-containing protein [Verrucomicrobium sp.]|nr:cytochrome b N-terminal domain-containing protein [Verrucomicrobium sp.]
MFEKLKNLLVRFVLWFEDRTGLWAMFGPSLTHLAPRDAKWWYVFGSATLLCFAIQVASGVGLAFAYIPSSGDAYQSLQYITNVAPLGRFLRAMHYFGASGMVLLVGIHMGQVFLHGSYKFPREMNWFSGVALLALTIVMGFTGQLMRWDSNAVWSIVVAAEQAGRVPFVGKWLAHFIMAGDAVGGATLGRFYAIHVFVVPGLLFAGIGLHLLLVMKHGIAEMPQVGQIVDPKTYREEYHARLEKTGIPFWEMAWRDSFFALATTLVICFCAWYLGPPPVDVPPDPSILDTAPAPDWYLLWYFAVLSLANTALEDYIILGAPLVIGLLLFCIPILSNSGERHPARRPLSVIALVTAVLFVFGFWISAMHMSWTPNFHPKPLSAEVLGTPGTAHYRGGEIFQSKSCINCHLMAGEGGRKGPDLTYIGDRATRDQLVIRINNGGIGMPGFAGNLTPQELNDLVVFLESRKHRFDEAAGEGAKPESLPLGTSAR